MLQFVSFAKKHLKLTKILRQGIKGTIYSYIGILLGYINWVLLFPEFLNKDEMGLVRIFIDSGLLMSTIFGAAVNQTLIKHYPYSNQGFSRKYLSTYVVLNAFALLVFTAFYFAFNTNIRDFFSSNAPLYNSYFSLVYWVVVLQIGFDFFEALNKIRLNISSATLIKEVLFKAMMLVLIASYGIYGLTLDNLMLGIIGIFFIQIMLMIYIFFRKWEPDQTPFIPEKPSKKELNYLLFMFLGSGGSVIVTQIDSIMTAGMRGLDYAAVYSMAVFMSSVIYMPFRTFTSISSPIISKYYAENLREEIKKLYQNSSTNLFFLGALIFLLIWFNADLIFSFIPEKNDSTIKFVDGKWVLFIIGFARLLDMITGVNHVILVHSKYYKMHFYTMPILSILTIGGNLLLIPKFEIIGAAIASLISVLIFNLIRYAFLWWKEGMQPFTKQTLILILLFTICLLPSFIDLSINPYIKAILAGFWILVSFVIPVYYLKISSQLNNIVQDKIIARFK
ncbi:MAG TPA: polysaccharide biosynthesis C-terminal domain-containing protein [Bacteroidia bacterium]